MKDTKRISSFATSTYKAWHIAIQRRLHELGLSADKKGNLQIEPAHITLNEQDETIREQLIEAIRDKGFAFVESEVAYTWFNRFCAIRYLETNDLLSHGLRVLTRPDDGSGIEMLDHVPQISDSLNLNKDELIDLKLSGDNEDLLFRKLILGQCDYLSSGMPFLFSEGFGLTELLLPSNLTRTDSPLTLIRSYLPERYWRNISVFSQLFADFYHDARKSLGNKTDLFELALLTQVEEPQWVRKFMVENTLTRRWQEIKSESRVCEDLRYYLPPVGQTESVAETLRLANYPDSAMPEQLRLLDPACGSGGLLLEAYEILYKIYLESGYRPRDIPRTILENNIVGLDIDRRAFQISSLVLMLRGLADDRRLLERGILPKIYNLSESGLTVDVDGTLVSSAILGSITELAVDEPHTRSVVDAESALSTTYDVVVCYPPNLGILKTEGSLLPLKAVANNKFRNSKSNLATVFTERSLKLLKKNGFGAFLLKDSWLFLSRYSGMREKLFEDNAIECLAQLGREVVSGQKQMNAVVFRHLNVPDYEARYCLTTRQDVGTSGASEGGDFPAPKSFPVENERLSTNSISRMRVVPTCPIAYWAPRELQYAFRMGTPFSKVVPKMTGGSTLSRNDHVRFWYELEKSRCGVFSQDRAEKAPWQLLICGGAHRRWYGNLDYVVATDKIDCNKVKGDANTWTALSADFNTRFVPTGSYYDSSGPCFCDNVGSELRLFLLGLTNTKVFDELLRLIYPENVLSSIRTNDLAHLPVVNSAKAEIAIRTDELVSLAKIDWDSVETSWGFKRLLWQDDSIVEASDSLADRYEKLQARAKSQVARLEQLETEVNGLAIESYQLQTVVDAQVLPENLSYFCNPYFRVKKDFDESEPSYHDRAWNLYKLEQVQALISYGVGCILGRYRPESDGPVYAESGGQDFTNLFGSELRGFEPDDDGIVPVIDTAWFTDDLTERFQSWLKWLFGEESYFENMAFIAEALSSIVPQKIAASSSSLALRFYFSNRFYNTHIDMYAKCPIYWLFSSGKHQAFECLVYMHRYNEATLPRMRTMYVSPLMGKLAGQLDHLNHQLHNADTAEATRIKKEIVILEKQQAELGSFDDKLRHYADQRISINLDDGVKVNYAKFGDLLAEVKKIVK